MKYRNVSRNLLGPSPLSVGLILIVVASLGHFIGAQGPLAPPGPPAPTMKTLDQIEARTPLVHGAPNTAAITTDDPDSHFIINEPGSYYLTGNLDVTRSNGIQVLVEDVTLDLNGFLIRRTTGPVGHGVRSTANSTVIRNGILRGFGFGIRLAESSLASNVHVHDSAHFGIIIDDDSTVERSLVRNSGNAGIWARENSLVTNCRSIGNRSGIEIVSGIVSNCSANYNTVTGIISVGDAGASVISCSASHNGSCGIEMISFGARVESCMTYKNERRGISVKTGSISNCVSLNNNKGGIYAGSGSSIFQCNSSGNQENGIQVTEACLVYDNTCNSNGLFGSGAGIYVTGRECTIRDNMMSNNDRGIDVDGDRNLIIANTVRDNGTLNFSIVAGNRVGHTIAAPLSGALNGSASQTAAAGVGTSNPWANLEY